MSDNNCYGPPFSLNGILTIQQSQLYIYKKAWSDFRRIQAYDSNISTLRSSGKAKDSNYYVFLTFAERDSFRIGQFLHQQQYSNSNWNSVERN
jgi:AICAR transformylase/IMP cyclohydrolase PurH